MVGMIDYKRLAMAFRQADKQREIEGARKAFKQAKKLEKEAKKKEREDKMKEVMEAAQKVKELPAREKVSADFKKGFKSSQIILKKKEIDASKMKIQKSKRKLNADREGYDFKKWHRGQCIGNQSIIKNTNIHPVSVDTRLWGEEQEELFTREEVKDMPAADFILHMIRWVAWEWQKNLKAKHKVMYTEHNKLTVDMIRVFESEAELKKTMSDMEVLIQRLLNGSLLKKFQDNYEEMITLALRREYKDAMAVFTELVMNHKTQHWRQPNMQHRVQQNHGGSIQKIVPTSAYCEFDADPEAIIFSKAWKRFFQYLQYLRPNDELERNFI